MKTLLKHSLLALTVTLAASSCVKDKAPNPSKVFNVAKFKALLKEGILKSKPTQPRGFSFVINQNGKWVDTCSDGIGYLVGDRVSRMRPDLEINVASVTKALTSIGVQQLLKKQQVDLGDSIGEYLPAYFGAVKPVRDITFRQLLTHTSGITSGLHGFPAMKEVVKQALTNPGETKYSNMNFALFRVIIPYLMNKTVAKQVEASMVPGNTEGFETWMSKQYVNYMQQHVFTPIGIQEALCIPAETSAMAFNEGAKLSFKAPEDWTLISAGSGYYLSTMEMARIMAYLSHTETLLSNEQKNQMDAELLGWDADDSWKTVAGNSYGKGGLLYWGERGLQTLVVKYPNKVELAVSVNSWDGTKRNLSIIALNAYNDSWE